jgi:integrase
VLPTATDGPEMKLTRDSVAKLAQQPKGERIVWDDDIPGFGVRLRPHSATYVFRYRHGARQPRVTLGNVSALSIQHARAEAARLYARTKLGEDPAGARAEARERANETFERTLRSYLIHMQAKLRPGSFENVDRHLMKHAAPLHRLELAKAAERRTVAALLSKVASDSGPREANSMKGSLSGFFVWAIGQGLLDGADPTIGMANAPTRGPRSHVPTDADMVKILHALRPGDFGDIVQLLTLTLCRLNEIAGLLWDEVDLPAGLIRLPAVRTKTGVARDVPMSKPVRAILARRQQEADGSRALVFGTGQGGFSGWSRAKRLLDLRAGVSGWVLHDLRRYGSSTMNAEGLALPHIIEAALGHVVGDRIARTYNWANYQEQVRVALELWGDRVTKLVSGERKPAKVLTLRRRKGA